MKKHQNFKPNYMQIQDYILYKIESGEYPVGSKIPSEVELAEMFSVSRITANKAIKELSIMGILERTRGRGTFVKDFSEEKNNSKAFVSAVKLELNAKRQHHSSAPIPSLEKASVQTRAIPSTKLSLPTRVLPALSLSITATSPVPLFRISFPTWIHSATILYLIF